MLAIGHLAGLTRASAVMMGSAVANYSISTEARYASKEPIMVGPYRYTRAVLDYTWHAHYTPERQHVQDRIIDVFLPYGARSERPWIVYTAGPMGAGKTYTMRQLHKSGHFPLDKFVLVDPDKIKDCMPDMPGYLAHAHGAAGSLTHKESGFMAEIIERESMQQSKCILVDGSLRDSNWYAKLFGRFRAEFPHYRIGIILVTASRERVYERCKRRAATTGREVPPHVIEQALREVPRSVEVLSSLVDYTVVIDNDNDSTGPVILPPETPEGFQAVWADIASLAAAQPTATPTPPLVQGQGTAALLELLQRHPGSIHVSEEADAAELLADATTAVTATGAPAAAVSAAAAAAAAAAASTASVESAAASPASVRTASIRASGESTTEQQHNGPKASS